MVLIPFLFASVVLAIICTAKDAAALPGTKWGTQIELGTVGNSTVWKVTDEQLTCLVFQPKNGTTPALTCWGAP